MYKLIHSPHLTSLAGSFCDSINKYLHSVDPLTSLEIIVPNRDTARWLSLFLAENKGISANMSYKLPSEWIWSRIREIRPGLPDLLPCDPGPMTWGIYSLLNETNTLQSFPLLQSYITRQSHSGNYPKWQLAKQISFVFDQYQVYRPEMLLDWEKNIQSGYGGWQRDLWNLLNNKWKSHPDPNLRYHRPELFEELINFYKRGSKTGDLPFFLFNPGVLPPPVDRLLKTMAITTEVNHFIILSSRSVLPPGENGLRNILLQCFGEEQQMSAMHAVKPSDSGNIQMVLDEVQWEYRNDLNLGRVQAAIRDNQPFPDLVPGDRSILVQSCHSPLREIEVLHQYLVGLFSDTPDLTPDDVLVVTPDIETYSPFIKAIFGTAEQGLPSIPFHLPGSSGGKSRAGRAFLDLLDIPDSRFKKEKVFDFIQQTAISDRFGLTQADFAILGEWFDQNRVVWGLDSKHRSEFKQPPEELQTWSEALRRGWLGQIAANEPGNFIDDTLLYSGVSTADEKELWARFQYIIILLEEMKRNSAIMKSADEWGTLLTLWINVFLPDTRSYEKEVQMLRDAVKKTVRAFNIANFTGSIPFQIVRKSLTEQIESHSAGGAFFTRGVLFNSMVPVRGLPFKVIALLGLNDDRFPRKPATPEFDLMAGNVLPGERDRKREDRNLFLESIMAAGEVHYCSYIGRNQKDDEKIPPSPILDEWIHIIAKSLRIKPSELVKEHSLNGFSPREFMQGPEDSFSNIYYNLAMEQQRAEGKLRGLQVDQVFELPDEPSQKIIAVDDFENFFRNPTGFFFRRRLDIYLRNPEDPGEQEFIVNGLNNYLIFQNIFKWVLNGFPADKMKQYLTQASLLPEGWPGEWMLNQHIDRVQRAVGQIRDKGHEPGLSYLKISHHFDDSDFKAAGEITSYSHSGMLDIYPSDKSGRKLIASWIRHLFLCLKDDRTHIKTDIFFDLKKGDGKWLQFDFEPEASSILKNLLDLYHKGLTEPVNLYIDTGFEYQWNLEKGEEWAMQKALEKWGGDFNPYPECGNRYLELIMGKNAEPNPEMIQDFSAIIMKPMILNLKGDK